MNQHGKGHLVWNMSCLHLSSVPGCTLGIQTDAKESECEESDTQEFTNFYKQWGVGWGSF